MAYISKIKPNGAQGTEYDLKDATARSAIENTNRNIQSSKTLKASVVTVNDAAPINAEDITVDITPVQDLHGYDKPWAGGAWKNLLPTTLDGLKSINKGGTWSENIYTHNGVTFTILMDDEENVIGINVDGTANNNAVLAFPISDFVTKHTGQSVIANMVNTSSGQTSYRLWFGTSTYVEIAYTYGADSQFTVPNTLTRGWLQVINGRTVSNEIVQPMLRLSTETDATFAPYSNICPIEGRTGAELDRVGKNWFDGTFPDIAPQIVTYRSIAVPNGTYTVSSSCPLNSAQGSNIFFLAGNVQTGASTGNNGVWVGQSRTVTTTNGYVTIAYKKDGGIDPQNYSTQLELGTQPTTCEPYQGQQYTASFGEVVYGGKWHVTDGGTDKTHANIASYNGETINEPWLSSLDEYSPGATPTTGAQVVYPLTTPTTISTPKQNVPMLKGINTVSADCGDTSLKYQPDNVIGELKGMIEDKVSTESIAITAGDGTNERSFTFDKKPLSIMVSYAAVGTYLQMFIVWGQTQYAFQAKSTNGQTPSVGLVTVTFDDDTNTMTITGSSQYDSTSALNHPGGSGVMAVTYRNS